MSPEKYAALIELVGAKVAHKMLADQEASYVRDARAARFIEQQLSTIAAHHAPDVWKAFTQKGLGSAMGWIAAFKAQDSTEIDRRLEAIRIAFDSGDDSAYADAVRALIELRRPQDQQQAGPRQYDTTAKEVSMDVLMDGISRTVQKTGGH